MGREEFTAAVDTMGGEEPMGGAESSSDGDGRVCRERLVESLELVRGLTRHTAVLSVVLLASSLVSPKTHLRHAALAACLGDKRAVAVEESCSSRRFALRAPHTC